MEPDKKFPPLKNGRDPRDIVTPYAFHVHPQLLGLPLAKPWQRAIAIGIDGLLIGALSAVHGGALLLIAAIVLFRWIGRAPALTRWRFLLRVAAACAALMGLFGLTNAVRDEVRYGRDDAPKPKAVEKQINHSVHLTKLMTLAHAGVCRTVECVRPPLFDFAAVAAAKQWDEQKSADAAAKAIKDLPVSEQERSALIEEFHKRYRSLPSPALAQAIIGDSDEDAGKEDKPQYSIVAWAKGILDDLGIGLGWAALYFSVFTAWWRGQTPGKKLAGIRAVRLDGKPFTLWTAFERYGGYGAGFATGLLGFAQVYWDRNRQAIHDKISETVVISGDLPVDLMPERPPAVPGIS